MCFKCVVYRNKRTVAQFCQGNELRVYWMCWRSGWRALHTGQKCRFTHTQIKKHIFYTEQRLRSRTPKSHIQRHAQCAKWCACACSRSTLESSEYRYSNTTTIAEFTECSIFRRALNRYWNSFVCTRKVAVATTTAINSSAQRNWCKRSAAELCVVFFRF